MWLGRRRCVVRGGCGCARKFAPNRFANRTLLLTRLYQLRPCLQYMYTLSQLISPLFPITHPKQIASSRANGDRGGMSTHSHSDDEPEESAWASWASEVGEEPIVSLLTDAVLPTAAAVWSELAAATGFSHDVTVVAAAGHDAYASVRVVNLVRAHVEERRKAGSADASALTAELSALLGGPTLAPGSPFWSDDAYLVPYLENDGLISAIFEGDDEADEERGGAEGGGNGLAATSGGRKGAVDGAAAASELSSGGVGGASGASSSSSSSAVDDAGLASIATEVTVLRVQLEAARSLIARLTSSADTAAGVAGEASDSSSRESSGYCTGDGSGSEDGGRNAPAAASSGPAAAGGAAASGAAPRHRSQRRRRQAAAKAPAPTQDNDTYYFNSEWRSTAWCMPAYYYLSCDFCVFALGRSCMCCGFR